MAKRMRRAGYDLVREDCWHEMRRAVTTEENTDLHMRMAKSWLNPSEKRPAFLYPKHQNDPIETEEFPALPVQAKSAHES